MYEEAKVSEGSCVEQDAGEITRQMETTGMLLDNLEKTIQGTAIKTEDVRESMPRDAINGKEESGVSSRLGTSMFENNSKLSDLVKLLTDINREIVL